MSLKQDFFQIVASGDPVMRDRALRLIERLQNDVDYSDKYYADGHEYRHVTLRKEHAALVPRHRLMEEHEWRALGVTMSVGWQHYLLHRPEPNVLLFKRPLPAAQPPTQPAAPTQAQVQQYVMEQPFQMVFAKPQAALAE
jgi:cyclin-dependent kinase regulatory subunit CKS1